jgi:hypothetical protein
VKDWFDWFDDDLSGDRDADRCDARA